MTSADTYHHGDLRRVLMDGALDVIASDGLAGLSLRAVAAKAGVSHAAPYHHFEDKASLVRSLGFEGLRLLDARMAAAEATAPGDAAVRLLAIGTAYVEFAAEAPAYFIAMGAPEMRATVPEHPAEAHGEPWERLVGAVAACQAEGLLACGDPALTAIGLWSLVEGLSQLWLGGAMAQVPHAADGAGPLARHVLAAMIPLMRPALPAVDPAAASVD